jgi:tRNA(His) guanylyltransferase
MEFCCLIILLRSSFSFGRFSEVHEFEKPNDKQALNLMNSCAVAVLEEIQDIIFAYGVSDEYRCGIFFTSLSFWML